MTLAYTATAFRWDQIAQRMARYGAGQEHVIIARDILSTLSAHYPTGKIPPAELVTIHLTPDELRTMRNQGVYLNT